MRFFTTLLFSLFILFTSTFADGYQSKEERIESIDKQIELLMEKKANLELLKSKIKNSNSEIIKDGNTYNHRPKIALVLSGGGAKGAAHIGVLKVLEKYQIPIDIVVGTSVGSIVGGMYSIGYSPEEIEKTVLNLDFTTLLTNSKDRNFKTLEDRVISDYYPFKLSIDKDFNLSLPMGFLNGEKIYLQLKDIFNRAEEIQNFDNFPIKYRAVTTNLNTGEQVIIKNGDLAMATFKSMAIPSFLEPVEDGGNFYVDGGVTNNFPIDVALSMGADIIIAVDISANEGKINQNSSVISILDKISTYNGNRNTQFQKQLADILIVPNVKEHNTIDFSNLKSLVESGEEAAKQYSYLLQNLSFPSEYEQIKALALKEKPLKIEKISLKGNSILKEERVRKLMPQVKNGEFSKQDLYLWTKKIYSIPYIERVFYSVEDDTITFTVKEKDGININASLNYTSTYGGAVNLAATVPNFGKWTKNYTLISEISEYPKVSLNRISFYDMNPIKLISAFNIGFESDPLFIYSDGKQKSISKSNLLKSEVSFATSVSDKLVAGLSLGYEYNDIDYSSGDEIYSDFNENYQFGIFKTFLFLDTLNKLYFPTDGVSILLEGFNGEEIAGDSNYTGFKTSFNFYFPLTQKFSLSTGALGGKIFGENIPNFKLFRLGGIRGNSKYIPFVGLPIMGKYSDEFYSAYIGLNFAVTDTLYLISKYNTITYSSSNLSFQENRGIESNWREGFGVGFGWDTFLGPISFIVSNDIDSSSPLLELYLGYTF